MNDAGADAPVSVDAGLDASDAGSDATDAGSDAADAGSDAADASSDAGDACMDNGPCGDPTRFTCALGDDGMTPVCVDVDECATDNGGCGDALYVSCTNNEGAPPTCADIDECAVDNGGCGDVMHATCMNNDGAAPTCVDIDECTVDNGGCGDAMYVTCVNNERVAPTCTDIDECATDNGGCGNPRFFACENNHGAAHTCGSALTGYVFLSSHYSFIERADLRARTCEVVVREAAPSSFGGIGIAPGVDGILNTTDDRVYTADYVRDSILSFDPLTAVEDPAFNASLGNPDDLAVRSDGSVFVEDVGRVRFLSPTGMITSTLRAGALAEGTVELKLTATPSDEAYGYGIECTDVCGDGICSSNDEERECPVDCDGTFPEFNACLDNDLGEGVLVRFGEDERSYEIVMRGLPVPSAYGDGALVAASDTLFYLTTEGGGTRSGIVAVDLTDGSMTQVSTRTLDTLSIMPEGYLVGSAGRDLWIVDPASGDETRIRCSTLSRRGAVYWAGPAL